ncbi:unnamed protein product [Gadus morhua 'NCC']
MRSSPHLHLTLCMETHTRPSLLKHRIYNRTENVNPSRNARHQPIPHPAPFSPKSSNRMGTTPTRRSILRDTNEFLLLIIFWRLGVLIFATMIY